jgi:photosystem II stability/assembly factor-like uncharacterized protein
MLSTTTAHSRSRHSSLLCLALVSMVAWLPAAAAAPASIASGLADAAVAGGAAASAPGPRWIQATPFGGSIVTLAQAPSSPRTLYAGMATGDLFASDDGGTTWSARHGGPSGAFINGLVVDPRDPATIYGLTAGGLSSALLRTRNGALTWKTTRLAAFPFALRLDAERPGLLYAATSRGLQRSSDAGEHWTVLAFADLPVLSLAIDPSDDRRMLAAVGSETAVGLWRSSDRGETWHPTPPTIPPGDFNVFPPVLVFDPARRGNAYALSFTPPGITASLFRTPDGGASWTALPPASGIVDLAASPSGTLYAATDFGVSRSDDAGATWQPPLADPTPAGASPPDAVRGVVVSAGSPETLFAAGTQGVWMSTDGGRHWADSSRGILAMDVLSLAAAPTGPSNVLAVAGRGIFGSRDHGHSWEVLHTDFFGTQPDRLEAFDPHDPQTIYGFGSDGQADHLLKSADGGREWLQLPFPYGCGGDSICDVTMTTLALDPASPEAIVVGGSYFFHFGGSGHFLLRSGDGGATWSALAPPDQLLSQVQLAIDPSAPAHYYLLTCGGFYGSQDAGASWQLAGRGLPRARLCAGPQQTLALDPDRPHVVYVGTRGRGVYRSTDAGATFQPFGKGLEFGTITTLIVDPADPAKLYAAVLEQGVWAWNMGTQTWMPLNAGLPIENFFLPLALDPHDPATLYAGTLLGGIFRLQPP